MKTSMNINMLAELASTQWGMFTSAQALREGVSRTQLSRMLKNGRIEQMARGTYRFIAAGDTSNIGAKAAWLSLFPEKTAYERLKAKPHDSVFVGRSAAALLGDTDLHAQPYCLATSKNKRTARTDIRLFSWGIDKCDVAIIDGLPVATEERTTADLLRLHEDPSLVGNFIANMAAQGHVFDIERLSTLLAPLAARNGYKTDNGRAFAQNILKNNAIKPMSERLHAQEREIEFLTSSIAGERHDPYGS